MSAYSTAAKSLAAALCISAAFSGAMKAAAARLDSPPPVAMLQSETIYMPSPCGAGRRMHVRVRAWSPCEQEMEVR